MTSKKNSAWKKYLKLEAEAERIQGYSWATSQDIKEAWDKANKAYVAAKVSRKSKSKSR